MGVVIEIRVGRDFQKVARRIERAYEEIGEEIPSGMRIIGEEIMADVRASRPGHGVPVDKGVLRSTGRVDGPDSDGVVTLGFGGPAAPYALRQHEELDYHHDIGEARYLVRGLERYKPGRAAEILRKNAERGIEIARDES